MPNEHMLSERAKQLVQKAKHRAGGMDLNLHPSGLDGIESTTRRISRGGMRWVHVDLKVDEEYLEDGGGKTDYILAHELGHAVRIATPGAEPAKVAEIYKHVEAAKMKEQRKNEYIQKQPREVRELLFHEEVVAWDIAHELFRGIAHQADTLTRIEEESLKSYRVGWGLEEE